MYLAKFILVMKNFPFRPEVLENNSNMLKNTDFYILIFNIQILTFVKFGLTIIQILKICDFSFSKKYHLVVYI